MSSVSKAILCIAFINSLGFVQHSVGLSRPSTIVLENNEYKNVIVAIHDSIAEDRTFIDILKDIMTKTSIHLYAATRQRAYLKEIKILLPSTWSNDASYQVPTSETLSFADVIITDPIRGKRSLPQTRSYDGCGKQGVHVLLTKEFLTSPRIEPYFSDPGKYLVHAFAQFRWGVFQEYAEEGETTFYMSPYTGQPEAIRCSVRIRGLVQKNDSAHTICYTKALADRQPGLVASIDEKTGLYQPDCIWRPYPVHQRVRASLMDHQYIREIVTFCDDNHTDTTTLHNYEAPNKHNRLCGHRSTWGIITQTDDFKDGRNKPRGLLESQLTPTFIIMRATSRTRRVAILIDPAMMKEPAKASSVLQAMGRLKYELSKHDTELAILQSRRDGISHRIITSAEDVKALLEQTYIDNTKTFEDHVEKAIQSRDVRETNIHLIAVTDNVTTNLESILNEARHKGLKLSAIAHQYAADRNHSALGLHSTGQTIGHTLLDRIRHVISEDSANLVTVIRSELHVSGFESISNCVDIDPTLANRITFDFHFEEELPYIDIRSPSSVIYDTESDVCTVDYDYKVIQFHFDFIEVGAWKYTVKQRRQTPHKVQVTIISEDKLSKSDPIVMRHSVKFADDRNNSLLLHVDATQGTYPVLGLKVTARIETPNGNTAAIQLLDNGAGSDISKNDGIYSRIFLANAGDNGLYHVLFVISGRSGDIFRKEDTVMAPIDETEPIKKTVSRKTLANNIQRHIYGGTLYVEQTELGDAHQDVIAPSRVTDLEAVKYIQYRNTLVLTWTAPGDDYDHGTPTAYQLFIGYDIKNIRRFLNYIATGSYHGNGHVAMETIAVKARATENEILLWAVKAVAKTYVFAVRALDESGNKGDISNVATAATV